MKIKGTLLFGLLVGSLLLLVGCVLPFDAPILPLDPDEHVCRFYEVERKEATCAEDGYVKYACSCKKTETDVLEKTAHTPVTVAEKAPSCTEGGNTAGVKCSVCGAAISGYELIDALGHDPIVDEMIPPTASVAGKTEGSHCDRCGVTLVKQLPVYASDYTNPERYEGDYSYSYLETLPDADELTELYDRIDEAMLAFHLSDTDVGADLLIAEIDYSDLHLSSEQAIGVWSAYKTDHPLYYWLSSQIKYSQVTLNILVYEEYASAAVRRGYNAQIYAAAERAIGSVVSDGTYAMTLAIHDAIIDGAYYAYESDGVTPEDAAFAHNVIGVLAEGRGVCESYAKAFQLMLNYCGVENIYVTGYAGEAHAWNLVRMDDGEWYWYDLTWDDDPDRGLGIAYNYFCVNDTQGVGWIDGRFVEQDVAFVSNHTPDAPTALGTGFAAPLPDRSDTEFAEADFLVRQTTFEVAGLTYSVCGNGAVQLVSVGISHLVNVPDSVIFGGVEFSVVSIGAFKEGSSRSYDAGSVFQQGSEPIAVSIGESVRFIWDNALASATLTDISVDADNEYFESADGVLFTKGRYTLIHYPSARSDDGYKTPEKTAQIASGAFRDLVNLKKLTFGKAVAVIGIANYGYGYNYGEDEINTVLTTDNEIPFIVASLASGGVLSFEQGNATYAEISGGVYTDGGKTLVSALDRSATSFVLHGGVEHIGEYALYYCTGISEIRYGSDSTAWSRLTVGKSWYPAYSTMLYLVCTDGTFTIRTTEDLQ